MIFLGPRLDISAQWTKSIAIFSSLTILQMIWFSRVTMRRLSVSGWWTKKAKSSIKMDMKSWFQKTSSRRCIKPWSQSMKQIRYSMQPKGRAELVSIWLSLVKKHQILEQQRPLKTKICYSHNIGSQVRSFGVVSPSSRWHISCVEIIKISEKLSKCQFIMEARSSTFAPSQVLYALSFLKPPEQAINIGLTMKIKWQWHILEKEQHPKVISIQL